MKAVYALGTLIPQISDTTYIAPNSAVIGNVILQDESSVWFGVTIRGDICDTPIIIGERSNVQDGAILHHDAKSPLKIGRDVTVGHKAMLHGCIIGDNTLIGMNACILNNAKIGKNCIIGANTLIPENKIIPDNSLVFGQPGKIIRQLTGEQVETLKHSADHYVENARWFRDELRPHQIISKL
jgi:carbonic anhydrase/acetyltransferase-like protein (isoleucine patch superfamily)